MQTLHLTNGDCALPPLRAAGLHGTFLPWRDVLHEGPVPQGLDLEALSSVRARFLAGRNWSEEAEIRRGLAERDQILLTAASFSEVVLWFEHDLYDQLQILQILSFLPEEAGPVDLVEIEGGLGAASEAELQRASSQRRKVEPSIIDLAKRAWAAFTAPTPEPWAALLRDDLSPLPHLRAAVLRGLEELPDFHTGLPGVERRALEILVRAPETAVQLFARYGEIEERPFLGDTVFYDRLKALLAGPEPLIRVEGDTSAELPFAERRLATAPAADSILSGQGRWTDLHPMDRWFGGTHLQPGSMWFWDAQQKELRRD